MSLKSIVRAGTLGAALRAIRDEHASMANRLAASSDALPALLLRGGEPAAIGAPVPAEPVLSGGAVPDGKEARDLVAALLALVPLPTAEEWAACGAGLLSEADCEAACAIVRARAVLRYVAEATGATLPPNDV